MLLKIISLGTFALGATMLFLPRADDTAAQYPVSDLTRSEMELIASLRDLARIPKAAATAKPVQREATKAGAPSLEVAGIAAVPEPAADQMVVTVSALNLRQGPSTATQVLGSLREGQTVQVAGRDGGWVQVATADGATGWAFSDYLAVATQ
jgi:uncharacterized protein YgiM (DUF1202 family)